MMMNRPRLAISPSSGGHTWGAVWTDKQTDRHLAPIKEQQCYPNN